MTDLIAPRAPWERRTVLALLAAAVVASIVGNTMTPVLFRESPVGLLAVLSSYAQMALASARVDPLTFVVVAGARRWIGDLIAFAGGRVLGSEVLAWYTKRSGRVLVLPERLNQRWWLARDAVVVLVPHVAISALLGVAGMPWRRFAVLKLVGSVLTVMVMWYVAGVVHLPLAWVADFVEANAVVLTVLAALAGGAWWMWQRRTSNGPAQVSEGGADR